MSVSRRFYKLNPQMSLGKKPIWQKIEYISKIIQNQQSYVEFSDNSIDGSLVLILKCTTVCEFYGCTTVLEGIQDFLNLQTKKNMEK